MGAILIELITDPDSDSDLFHFKRNRDSLKVQWMDGRHSEYPYVWLRDNCRCAQCVDPRTHQRNLDTFLHVPDSIAPVSRTPWILAQDSNSMHMEVG